MVPTIGVVLLIVAFGLSIVALVDRVDGRRAVVSLAVAVLLISIALLMARL